MTIKTWLCCLCVNRTDSGPEDRNSEEGGTAVLNEDVHGLPTLFHLPHEVCVFDSSKCYSIITLKFVFFFTQEILQFLDQDF